MDQITKPDSTFWQDKRVLVTGHTGFKGAWLTVWLKRMGAVVTGISLPPTTSPNLFEQADLASVCETCYCDITDLAALTKTIQESRPDVVFHLAAQALVRQSYRQPIETFNTNMMGTVHLLEAIRQTDSINAAIMITTDKVYRNNEWAWPYRETDHLGGHDPYSASKAACEIIIDSYRKAFLAGVSLASARAGNVIGGGDWAEERLIPDAIRAWQKGETLHIRRPEAVRPWQHVLEPLAGYLCLTQQLWEDSSLAGAYNFGPQTHTAASVRSVINLARDAFGEADVTFEHAKSGPHEAEQLTIEIAKARQVLGFQPRWTLQEAVRRTIQWYRGHLSGDNAYQLCMQDITAYEEGHA